MRAEQTKKSRTDKRTPIPYYLIDAFAKYECSERNPNLIREKLENATHINSIIKLYTAVSGAYTREYNKKHNIEYNMMIKSKIEYDILESQRDTLKSVIEMEI